MASYNKIILAGNDAALVLNDGSYALIDASDLPKARRFAWRRHSDGYVVSLYYEIRDGEGPVHSRRKHKILRLHRFLMDAVQGQEVDHRDNDPLNNRRSNLRFATSSQQKCNRRLLQRNRSGHKGVIWDRHRNKWMAYGRINNKFKQIGRFDNFSDAVLAREAFAIATYGEFAKESA